MKADCASQGDGLGGSLPEVGAGGAEEVVTTAWRGEMLKGGEGGHAWLAVASAVSLTPRPSRHPCQH